jgi:hypothetical protein
MYFLVCDFLDFKTLKIDEFWIFVEFSFNAVENDFSEVDSHHTNKHRLFYQLSCMVDVLKT